MVAGVGSHFSCFHIHQLINYVDLHLWVKVGLGSSDPDSGKGKSKMSKNITHGFHLPDFWKEPADAVKRAYSKTDSNILEMSGELGRGGSTAVTAILVNCQKLIVANIGDSRAVLCKKGVAKQLSVDHEPNTEHEDIKNRGGFVSNFPGDVPRVDGRLAVSRAFGDKSLKKHLSSEPFVTVENINDDAEFIILASDGLWKVMSNQEAVNCIKNIKDARSSAKRLTEEAVNKKSTDDISCIVVKFQ
ncbi:probable protein phosphatase 2C 39 isoform X4 [Vigna radiata var. radiata]|uniref:protein-serine/threonine phosphatase n=1 Tax=Vigna radiata var. radiata TaxID=3916 RepID=A0A3Q0EZX3_VIGRR|nr:probable protein phosphatase 2C 39 isoform X4 [Vigna radiata var. radiata]